MSQSQLPEDDYFSRPPQGPPAPGQPAPGQPASQPAAPDAESSAGSGLFASPISELPAEPEFVPPPPPDSAARRRRQRRRVEAGGSEQLAALILLGTPGFDFFLSSLVIGLILAAGVATGAPALYLLAALMAPFMAPVVGLAAGVTLGSLGLFFRSLASLLIGGLLVLAAGVLAGMVAGQIELPPQVLVQAGLLTAISWPNLLVPAAGALVTLFAAGRTPDVRPLVSSVAIAYGLYLPVGVAGFGLGANLPALWQPAAQSAGLALAVVTALGALVLLLAGVHPRRFLGWLFFLVLFGLTAAGGWFFLEPGLAGLTVELPSFQPTPTLTLAPSVTPTLTLTIPPTFTPTQLPSVTPQPTRTTTSTIVPTQTPTPTLAPSPTPVWGLINAGEFKGAIIRPEPGSADQVTSLLNGAVLQILPEIVNRGGVIWLHVRTPDGKEGWVQSSLILTATPAPR